MYDQFAKDNIKLVDILMMVMEAVCQQFRRQAKCKPLSNPVLVIAFPFKNL